jgi:uncharacterized protein (TIGR03089 family)
VIDPWHKLSDAVRDQPSAPFVTWYGVDGTRAELSVVSYANGVAKTAGFLQDVLLVEPGDRIRVQLGLHWQTSIWLGACAILGVHLDLRSGQHDREPVSATVSFAAQAIADSPAEHKVVVSAHPMGLPGPELPPTFVDHAREALAQPDVWTGGDPDAADFEILDDNSCWDASQIATAATAAAKRWQIGSGETLVSSVPPNQTDGWLSAWAVPLLTGCRVVLCDLGGAVDLASISAVEGATAVVPAL